MSRYWRHWCLCLTWRCSHSLTGNCYKFDLCSRVLSELRLLICYDTRCKVGASDTTNNLFHCISGTQANPAHIHTLLSTYLPTRVCENKSRHALDAGGVWACRFLYVKRWYENIDLFSTHGFVIYLSASFAITRLNDRERWIQCLPRLNRLDVQMAPKKLLWKHPQGTFVAWWPTDFNFDVWYFLKDDLIWGVREQLLYTNFNIPFNNIFSGWKLKWQRHEHLSDREQQTISGDCLQSQ